MGNQPDSYMDNQPDSYMGDQPDSHLEYQSCAYLGYKSPSYLGIDPVYTWAINPRHTPSLKPNSPSFKGYLVVDKNTDMAIYYTVNCKVNDVLLVFDGADNPAFVAVGRAGGYSIFNFETMEYVGYMASNGKDGYNWFSVNGEWLYYVVKKN